MRSRVPPDLLAAFRATLYRVELRSGQPFALVIGRRSPAAERLLARAGADSGAFLTAFNPQSRLRSEAQNAAAQRALERELKRLRYAALPGAGIGSDPDWPAERSVFVPGLPRAAALRLARKYRQLAFVYVRAGARVELVWLRYGRDKLLPG